jgi:hypothetical protein
MRCSSGRCAFTEPEALLVGGAIGVVHEVSVSGAFLAGPATILLLAPLAWVIYAAVFLAPLQLVRLSEGRRPPSRWAVGFSVPLAASTAVGLGLWLFLGILRVSHG